MTTALTIGMGVMVQDMMITRKKEVMVMIITNLVMATINLTMVVTNQAMGDAINPVSYTHLTLPTIYSV